MRRRIFKKKINIVLSISVFIALNILVVGQAQAQVSGATLSGTVTDPSGAAIPMAQVSIKAVATGVTREVVTDSAGFYAAPNLQPGGYQVAVTASGFSTAVQSGITLTVGAQQSLSITMRVGQVSQTVEVTTEAPTVQLTSSTISAEVNATTVRELPLNGRSWTDLANLQPGVITAETHPASDVNRGFGAQVSISGARPQQNNYRLDGVSINDYANGGPGSVLGGNLGVDAIQEFSVLTSNYSAEYGKTSGGVVNAITRSGTNQFHGDVYEFLRNSALDARNFFDAPKIPPFRRNQFGASAGAPIRKDKTFIFGDYEGIRQSLGVTHVNIVPSPAARKGILAGGTPLAGACPAEPNGATSTNLAPGQATTCVDDAVAAYLVLEPLPNAGLIGAGDTGFYNFAGQQVVSENFVTIRADQKISDKDSLFGTYSFDNSPLTQPDALGNVLQQAVAKRQIVALEENHTFSQNVLNSFRLGYNRAHTNSAANVTAINPVAGNGSFGWLPGLNATSANVSGLTPASGPSSMGPFVFPPPFKYVWNAYQVYDDAFVTKGLHTFKFGGGFEQDQLNQVTLTATFLGQFTFKSLANFINNQPSRFAGSLPNLISPRYMRASIVGAYAQDDWRVRPNLTVNLGLRYEMSTVPSETQGKLTNLPTVDAAAPQLGGPYFSNPTLRDFEPRVGFSWDPFKSGKTAVRGGFGMFDTLPLLYMTVTMNGREAPFFDNASTSDATALKGRFPGKVLPILGLSNLENGFVEHNPKRSYVMQYNLNIQRELSRNLTVVVGYVGSRGVHQAFRTDDGNIVLPTASSAGYLWPSPLGKGTKVNPNVGVLRLVDWGGSSFYNALQVGVVKKISHGLQIQGSFTWNKSIDSNSGIIAGDTLNGNAIQGIHWYDLKLVRGVSDYNIGRVLVVNASWQLPSIKSSGPVGWVANGWQLGGILKVSDGPPFTPFFGTNGDPLGTGSGAPYDLPNVLSGSGCSSLVNPGNVAGYIKTECFGLPTAPNMAFWQANCDTTSPVFGASNTPEPFPICFNLMGNASRNMLRGPGLVNFDFSLFKNNYIRRISETFNAQFRAEVFNALNHANFALPSLGNQEVFNANGTLNSAAGRLASTITASRQIQFALKVIW
jgi:hypothetical protein